MELLGLLELPTKPTMIGLLGGLVLLYASVQAIVSAMGGAHFVPPSRRAISQWIPVAITSIFTLFLGRSDLAVGVVFATSVAALALGVGAVAATVALDNSADRTRRLWPFVLPTALLALLAGFSAQLNWIHAMILLVEGLVLFALQTDRTTNPPYVTAVVKQRGKGWLFGEWILGLAIALLGGYLAAHFTISASKQVLVLSGTAISTVILGPGLILPLLGRGTTIAQEGRGNESVTAYVIFTLLNLCLLLPILTLLGYIAPALREFASIARHTHVMPWPALMAGVENAKPIVYPLAVWRLDTVLLVVLGLLLLPVSQFRLHLGRREGAAIVIGYWMYLLVAVTLATRG